MTAATPSKGGAAKRRPSGQQGLYWSLWGKACAAKGWHHRNSAIRHSLHLKLGLPDSHTEFTCAHFDRVFRLMELLIKDTDLDAAIELVAYENHAAALAIHQPVISPGKKYRSRGQTRAFASKYEQMPNQDDPGERRRIVYVISRLFEPPLVKKMVADLFHTSREFRDLPLSQLILLRDLLKSRLGKWLTAVKDGAPGLDQLRAIPLCNPITGRPSSNKDIIKALLKRGNPIRMEREKQAELLTLE